MELGKRGSPDTSSSQENDKEDRRQVIKEETSTATNPSTTTKRFYECSFCKKGFDNAQALGGHMNIHRGAKSKARQGTSSSSVLTKSNEDYWNPTYNNMAPVPSHLEPLSRGGFYPVLEARSNHHMYFQPSGSGPGQAYGYNYQYGAEFLVPRSESLGMNDDQLWGSNLSLRTGSGHGQETDINSSIGVANEDEVDLELRLGHHDRY